MVFNFNGSFKCCQINGVTWLRVICASIKATRGRRGVAIRWNTEALTNGLTSQPDDVQFKKTPIYHEASPGRATYNPSSAAKLGFSLQTKLSAHLGVTARNLPSPREGLWGTRTQL